MAGSLSLLAATAAMAGFFDKDAFCSDIVGGLKSDIAVERIVLPTNTSYATSVQQYSYSSMPEKFAPSAVVYCLTTAEVQKAVWFATYCDYTISTRSGGHQYAGLSTCNSANGKCMQIDVSRIESVSIGTTTVVLGPGVRLDDMATQLANNGLFVPTGECNAVNVGGHAQTGGSGYFSRSFGLFADHVVSFEIVLAGGIVKTVTKPTGEACLQCLNDNLFWAVLGGNAGSWGVVTKYEVRFRRDVDYPQSQVYRCVADFTREGYQAAIEVLNEMVADPSYATSAAGDESVTINCGKLLPSASNYFYLTGSWSGVTGAAFNSKYFNKFNATLSTRGGMCFTTPYPLSAIFRDYILMGRDREYPFPYAEKQARGSRGAMDSNSIAVLASEVAKIVSDGYNGVYPVVQIATFGGAANTAAARATSPVPNRNYDIVVGLDGFYYTALNPNAKTAAAAFVTNTWAGMMNSSASSFIEDRRVPWAQWGDINIETQWQYYWDAASYLKLRTVKTTVDPSEVFRSSFSIPPFTRQSS